MCCIYLSAHHSTSRGSTEYASRTATDIFFSEVQGTRIMKLARAGPCLPSICDGSLSSAGFRGELRFFGGVPTSAPSHATKVRARCAQQGTQTFLQERALTWIARRNKLARPSRAHPARTNKPGHRYIRLSIDISRASLRTRCLPAPSPPLPFSCCPRTSASILHCQGQQTSARAPASMKKCHSRLPPREALRRSRRAAKPALQCATTARPILRRHSPPEPPPPPTSWP